jgi:predicted dehydrogenase
MRTVVLGAGRMGRRHVQIVQGLGLELTALCDQIPGALEQSAAELKLDARVLVTDIDEALARRPECVVVATTAQAHADYVCLAAEAGARFVLCEKPMAVSLEQCDRMLAVCKRTGCRLAINHQMRFMEQYIAPKRLLDSDAFGGLTSANVVTGNFGLAMNATHYVEAFRYLAGEAPVTAGGWFSAETVPNPRGPQFIDRAGCIRLETAGGKRFYLDCSADQGHGMNAIYGARNGHVVIDELRGRMSWVCRQDEHRDLPTTRYGMPWNEGDAAIAPADSLAPTRSVLEALLKQENYPSGDDGRLAVAVLVAATMSHEEGHRQVPIAETSRQSERVFPWA